MFPLGSIHVQHPWGTTSAFTTLAAFLSHFALRAPAVDRSSLLSKLPAVNPGSFIWIIPSFRLRTRSLPGKPSVQQFTSGQQDLFSGTRSPPR